MENFEEHIRHILFYYFKKEKKASEAREKFTAEISSKNASSLRQKCRQKAPVPELVRPIP